MFKLNAKHRTQLQQEVERQYANFTRYRLEIPTGCIVSPKPFGSFNFTRGIK